MTSKADLRRLLIERHTSVLPLEGLRLIEWLQNQSGVWGVYQALPGELDPQEVIRKSSHLQWVYPRILGTGLSFHVLGDRQLVKGSLTWEPPAECPLKASEEISGLLIPGLAFDRRGVRLGRGQGFYDRFLASFGGMTVGMIPQSRIYPELPQDDWDVRMNYLATEDQFLVCH